MEEHSAQPNPQLGRVHQSFLAKVPDTLHQRPEEAANQVPQTSRIGAQRLLHRPQQTGENVEHLLMISYASIT